LLTVTPEFDTATVAPDKKLVPVRVTFALVPGAAAFGLMEVRVGAPEPMLKWVLPLVPPAVVTVTFTEPDALAEIAKLAVICVELATVTLLTVTPELSTLTVVPDVKFVPVRVTFTFAPDVPALGVIEVSVGAAALIVKATVLVVPAGVLTLTFAELEALAAIANTAVS